MRPNHLLAGFKTGVVELKNRVVMAPMTRCRAIGNLPNDLMATYYSQRAGAGLIITEGTSPSPNGLGYARIPGIFTQEQIDGWKLVTDSVHVAGSKIFVQLMHTGRIGHADNLPDGARILAPSSVKATGQMWTDNGGMQDLALPEAMTIEEILTAKAEFVQAAKNAIMSGFDGVELHGANGYLLEEFLSPLSNIREDEYGGTVANRCRFVVEVAKEVALAIGPGRTGIRLSPYGVASDMPHYPEIDETYLYLSNHLNELGIAYIHLVDHSSMGAPTVPQTIKDTIRQHFKQTLILCGGFTRDKAIEAIENGDADLIAFGKPFICNPDLVDRIHNDQVWSTELHMDSFYSADSKGYTDYGVFNG